MEPATPAADSEVTVFHDGLEALRESVRRSVADEHVGREEDAPAEPERDVAA